MNESRENIIKIIKATGFLRRDFTDALREQTLSENNRLSVNSAPVNFFEVDYREVRGGSDQLNLLEA